MAEEHELEGRKHRLEAISRRLFLQGVVAGSAGSIAIAGWAGAMGPTAGMAAHVAALKTLKTLTAEQGRMLTAVLNRIIPPNSTLPGAGDLGLISFMDTLLDKAPHLREPVLGVLAALPDGAGTAAFSDDKLDELLHRFEHDQKASFNILLHATYTGYYSHPLILEALGAESDQQAELSLERFDRRDLDAFSEDLA